MKYIFILLSTFSLSCASQSKTSVKVNDQLKHVQCHSAREYVVTYKYLFERSEKLGITNEEVKNIANDVADGCTGAAERFVSSFELLNKVGLGGRASLNTGVRLAQKSSEHSHAFIEIFKKSYLKKHLNLDLKSSYELASYLALEYAGSVKTAYDDFEKLTKFCTDSQSLNLPLPLCAKMAAKVSHLGEHYEQGIADSFIKTFHYINNKGPLNLDVKTSLNMAEKIVASSPYAEENFRVALEFAISEKGLKLGHKDAIPFAQSLAEKTNAKANRWPANDKNKSLK